MNGGKFEEIPFLKVLLKARHLQAYGPFAREYRKVAGKIDRTLAGTEPSKAQFYRWISGELVRLPHSHHCRVLETMFPDWSVEQLFQPCGGNPHFLPVSGPDGKELHSHVLDLSGRWWCAWQTSKDDAPRIDTHLMTAHQQGETLHLVAEGALAEGS